MRRTILEVSHVTKQFATVKAVDGISLDVQSGEIFALLGPNGAGKSTLVRMMTGIIQPDTGSVQWNLDGNKQATLPRETFGYLPEDRGLYRDQKVLSTLVYFGKLRGMTTAAARAASFQWLERLQLSGRAHEKLDALSKGNQQKVQFITSIVHKPAVAVLDEPFSGLDPLNQQLFCELLQSLRADGMTILLSAHQMQLVERLADRLLLMSHGKRVLYGTLAEIRSQTSASKRLRLHTLTRPELLATIPGVSEAAAIPAADAAVELLLTPDATLGAVITQAAAMGPIHSLHADELSLHDIYVKALGGSPSTESNPNEQEAST